MKFPSNRTETFIKNLIKHKLNGSEYKVFLRWLCDSPKAHFTKSYLASDIGMARQNLQSTINSLVNKGLLIESGIDGDKALYEFNPKLIDDDYVIQRPSKANRHVKNDFKDRAVAANNKRLAAEELNRDIRKKIKAKKTGSKSKSATEDYGYGDVTKYKVDDSRCVIKSDGHSGRVLPSDEIIRYLESQGYSPEEVMEFLRHDGRAQEEYAQENGFKYDRDTGTFKKRKK